MPLTPEGFHARALAHADGEGRLPLPPMHAWEVFPFAPDGLTVVPLAPPALPETARAGAGGADCRACAPPREPVWSDPHWRLADLEGGAPLVLVLQPRAHHDLADLPDDWAAEFGRLLVHLARAVESLPHVARAHVSRWGDGAEHLHVFVDARPAGFAQLRGTCFAVWDDLLPPTPADERRADALAVGRALEASYGGTAAAG